MHEFEDSDDEDDDVFDTSPISSEQDLPPTTSLEASSIYVVDSQTEHVDTKRGEEAVYPPSSQSQMSSRSMTHRPLDSFRGSSKITVVVRDVAYTTYRAMLYYVGIQSVYSGRPSLTHLLSIALHR